MGVAHQSEMKELSEITTAEQLASSQLASKFRYMHIRGTSTNHLCDESVVSSELGCVSLMFLLAMVFCFLGVRSTV